MEPNDPRHGTTAGFGAHLDAGIPICEPCREARRRYYRRYHKERARGYVRRIPTNHGDIWDLLDDAVTNWGHSYESIANAIGLPSNSHLWVLHTSGPDHNIRPATWKRLATLNPATIGPTNVGTLRRMRALHAKGWTNLQVCALANITPEVGKKALRGEQTRFTPATREAIAAVYEALENESPEPSKGSTRAIRRAQREGWPPPAAWDNPDDPHERPHGHLPLPEGSKNDLVDHAVVQRLLAGERVQSTRAEKEAAMTRWLATGRPERLLCDIHGWKAGRYVPRNDEGDAA